MDRPTERRIPIADLRRPEREIDPATVERLRRSLERYGQFGRRVLVTAERVVIDGLHLLEAAVARGEISLDCDVIPEGWDALDVRVATEVARKPRIPDDMLAEWASRYEQTPAEHGKRGGTRRKSAKSQETERVGQVSHPSAPRVLSDLTCESQETTRKRIARAKKKAGPPPAQSTVVRDEVGNVLPIAVAASYLAATTLCEEVERHLLNAQAAYTRKKHEMTEAFDGRAAKVLGHLQFGAKLERLGPVAQVAHLCRSRRPYALCPACKAHGGGKIDGKRWAGMADCDLCRATGWIGEAALARVEDALRVYGADACVAPGDGRIVAVRDIVRDIE